MVNLIGYYSLSIRMAIQMLEGTTPTLTMTELLSDATTLLNWFLSHVIEIFNVMTSSPIVIAFIVCALIGVLVRYTKKFMHA